MMRAIKTFDYDSRRGTFRGWLFTLARNSFRNFSGVRRTQGTGGWWFELRPAARSVGRKIGGQMMVTTTPSSGTRTMNSACWRSPRPTSEHLFAAQYVAGILANRGSGQEPPRGGHRTGDVGRFGLCRQESHPGPPEAGNCPIGMGRREWVRAETSFFPLPCKKVPPSPVYPDRGSDRRPGILLFPSMSRAPASYSRHSLFAEKNGEIEPWSSIH